MAAITIDQYTFAHVCQIIPTRNPNGSIQEVMPQDRYSNTNNIGLHRYGQGPFCSFRIPNNLPLCGVYVITVNDMVVYIGECENLSQRYNIGYGQISPRNPFEGGQQTNCRINNLILGEAKYGKRIDLWFLSTNDYKRIEYFLRASKNPPWNRV